MQWRTAMVLIVSLWCIALPLIIWFAFVQGGGLQAQWTLLPICYTFMQVLLVATYTSVDWGARSARLRHSSVLVVTADDMEDLYSEQLRAASENTPLLHVSSGDKLGHS